MIALLQESEIQPNRLKFDELDWEVQLTEYHSEIKFYKEELSCKENDIYALLKQLELNKKLISNISSQINDLFDLKNFTDLKKAIRKLQYNVEMIKRNDKRFYILNQGISKVNNLFLSRLMNLYPNLTKSEIELIGYLKLNLSSKQIAQVKNVTLASIRALRYRLRKKMKLKRKEELVNILSQL